MLQKFIALWLGEIWFTLDIIFNRSSNRKKLRRPEIWQGWLLIELVTFVLARLICWSSWIGNFRFGSTYLLIKLSQTNNYPYEKLFLLNMDLTVMSTVCDIIIPAELKFSRISWALSRSSNFLITGLVKERKVDWSSKLGIIYKISLICYKTKNWRIQAQFQLL